MLKSLCFAGKFFDGSPLFFTFIAAILLFLPNVGHAELTIDGRLDEPGWAEAQVFSDFRVIDPLTYNTPRLKTEARLLSLPEGLAVAFICEQPEETRTRTVTQRDTDRFDADVVNLVIDFDGKTEKNISIQRFPGRLLSRRHPGL